MTSQDESIKHTSKFNAGRLWIGAFLFALFLVLTGCASIGSKPADQTMPQDHPPVIVPVGVDDAARDEMRDAQLIGGLERTDLKSVKKVILSVSYADVSLAHRPKGTRHGHLKIDRMQGGEHCKLSLIEYQNETGEMKISDGVKREHGVSVSNGKSTVPPAAPCRFKIDLALPEPAPVSIDMSRGSVSAEEWGAPMDVHLEWGDVDVGAVGPLKVECGRCTLSGEGVNGPLNYNLHTGNVGLAGLSDSVEGQTLGDTVLRWRQFKPGARVKVLSKAGDVILFVPHSVALGLDTNAPHGEVSTKIDSMSSGVPISVTAELGNVQIYRESAPVKKTPPTTAEAKP